MNYQNTEGSDLKNLRIARWSGIGPPLLLIAIAAVLFGGCATDDAGTTTDPFGEREYALAAFDSCDGLDDYIADMATDLFLQGYVYNYGYGGRGGVDFDSPTAEPGADLGNEDGGGEQSPDDYTTTNVQEAGVDEPDQMKTDGDNVYYLQNGVLHIIDSWPAEEAMEIARVELDDYASSMFLAGDYLVTFGHVYEGNNCYYGDCYYDDVPVEGREPAPAQVDPDDGTSTDGGTDGGDVAEPEPTDPEDYFQGTRVRFFDVRDPANPTQTRQFDIEGSMVNARMVDGIVYLITMRYPEYDQELWAALDELDLGEPWNMTDEEREEAAAALRPQVHSIILDYLQDGGRDSFIPDLREGDARENLLSCGEVMRSGRRSDLSMLVVAGFDPTSDADPNGRGLIANGWQVYGSEAALYVVQSSQWWWWPDDEPRFAETHIHRFVLNDGAPLYSASGSVPGWLTSQFSMSEHNGYLRVATTDQTLGNWWWGGPAVDVAEGGGGDGVAVGEPSTTEPVSTKQAEPEPPADANNVFVLQPVEGELEIVGEVRGLAPNEQIYAVRFMGDRGYMVTFRQVDPLFTLDLSDPTNPRSVGELKIPGFSTYLHPIDDDTLIGIGRDATEEGRVRGLQLQIFDVSDPSDPVRLHQELLSTSEGEWSYSQAEHDHHAFTYYASQGLLAIPVTTESYGWEDEAYNYFSGVVVFDVSAEDGFTEVGRVSHSDIAHDAYCEDLVGSTGDACGWERGWWAWMQRSAFIEDYLYAFSNVAVTASAVEDLSNPVSTILLD